MLGKARITLGSLSPDDLKLLAKDVDELIALYEGGGATTGWGSLELKSIPRKQAVKNADGSLMTDPATGALIVETVYHGPYLYIRRWTVDEQGRRRYRTVGYYGKAGAEAVNRGLGPELLRIHNERGEDAVEEWMIEQGIVEEAPRRWVGKPPASPPVHPLPGLQLTAEQLATDLLFLYFTEHAPVIALRLLLALRDYESDLDDFRYANEKGFGFRLSLHEIERRRRHERMYKSGGRPKFRIRAVRERR